MKNQIKELIFIVLNILFFAFIIFIFIKSNIPTSIKYISLIFPLLNIIFGRYLIIKTKNEQINKEEKLVKNIKSLEFALDQQNIHIRNQQEEIYKHLETIKAQQNEIEYQRQKLKDNINFAFTIQQAIFPPYNDINSILNDYFILYLPKASVSGDFYFVEQEKDYTIIAVADCKGHGVSTAIMSVTGYELLNRAVKINHITKPSSILSFVNQQFTNFLQLNNGESQIHDNMYISVISIYKQLNIVEFAGAHNKLYFTHKNNIHEIKGDKLPVGMNIDNSIAQYTNHGVQVSKGDMLYIFSNGYANQFGGTNNKKFKYKALKRLLLDIYNHDTTVQKQILADTLKDWQGTNEQTDDVLIFGVRI